ncbi:MAG: hypothetical protein JSW66_13135 [Phycisphaerales bacterium]|nr:MAG: hypothetical protein JSW66_13135 [Phycisphaerales bacterium]
MNPADNIERSIARLHVTTRAETDKRILADSSAALQTGLKQRPLRAGRDAERMSWLIRIAAPAAVAAGILLACALLFNALFGKGTSPAEVRKAFAKVENVCIATCRAGATEPFEQVWASQTLKVKLFRSGSGNQAQFTLWDVPNKVKMMKFLTSEPLETEPITEQMLAELSKSVIPSAGLLTLFDTPADAQWSKVDDPQAAATVPGAEVCEVTFFLTGGSPSGTVIYRRWRLFTDRRTHLPKRAEWYTKSEEQDDYRLETFVIFSYPSASEIDDLVTSTFGTRRPEPPEYIPTPGMDR